MTLPSPVLAVTLKVALPPVFAWVLVGPAITGRLIARIPDGSYLVVSAGHLEGDTGQQFSAAYGPGQLHHHTREDLAGFLAGLQLVDPGITEARAWRAPELIPGRPCHGRIWAAVGHKTSPAGRETT